MFLAGALLMASVVGPGLLAPVSVGAAPAPVNDVDPNQGRTIDNAEGNIEPNDEDCKKRPLTKDNCGIVKLVVFVTNILGGIAGIVIVGVLIWGGIMYSMAGADPSKITAAKGKIVNALTALLLYVFGFALLQWLVPGGLI